MQKRFKTRFTGILRLAGISVLGLMTLIYCSPYGNDEAFPYKLIKQEVEIEAPVEKVFQYLGNSDHAAEWSVFVDHISPLNNDQHPDGEVGSERRCFVQADENGMRWDELTTEVVPNRKRQLTIYNLTNFSMTADHLMTEQLYERLDNGKCKLTFTVFFEAGRASLFEKVKMYVGAYRIKAIFRDNMNNIKWLTEKIHNESNNANT